MKDFFLNTFLIFVQYIVYIYIFIYVELFKLQSTKLLAKDFQKE